MKVTDLLFLIIFIAFLLLLFTCNKSIFNGGFSGGSHSRGVARLGLDDYINTYNVNISRILDEVKDNYWANKGYTNHQTTLIYIYRHQKYSRMADIRLIPEDIVFNLLDKHVSTTYKINWYSILSQDNRNRLLRNNRNRGGFLSVEDPTNALIDTFKVGYSCRDMIKIIDSINLQIDYYRFIREVFPDLDNPTSLQNYINTITKGISTGNIDVNHTQQIGDTDYSILELFLKNVQSSNEYSDPINIINSLVLLHKLGVSSTNAKTNEHICDFIDKNYPHFNEYFDCTNDIREKFYDSKSS